MAQEINFSLLNPDNNENIERVCKALSSPVRLNFIRQIHEKPMTIAELAKANGLTNSTVIFHLNILSEANIISVRYLPSKKGMAQVAFLSFNNVVFTREGGLTYSESKMFEQSASVGSYVDADVEGLGYATEDDFYDSGNALAFDEKHVFARQLWAVGGHVTYAFENSFAKNGVPDKITFSLEICSETTCYRNDWKSDIFFVVNGVEVAHYLSPGDFGGSRGRFTPEWWPQNMTQYGNLVEITVDETGSYLNNQPVSKVKLSDLRLDEGNRIAFTVECRKKSTYYGGFNLFGKGSGNFDQDILFFAIYHEK